MAKKKLWIPLTQKNKSSRIENLRLDIQKIIESEGDYLRPKSLRKILKIEREISKLV